MGSAASIVIVEDDPVVLAHIRRVVEHAPDLEVVGQCDSVAGAIALLDLGPDLVLLDLGLVDGSGLDVIRTLRQHPACGACRVLVLTLFSDEERVLQAFGEGASGYLLKDAEAGRLVEDIRATLAGEAPISPAAAVHLLKRFRASAGGAPMRDGDAGGAALTAREIDLLQLLGKGLSYKDAAAAMAISLHTVRDHVKNIYRKMDVNSRGEAVFEAVSAGVISL